MTAELDKEALEAAHHAYMRNGHHHVNRLPDDAMARMISAYMESLSVRPLVTKLNKATLESATRAHYDDAKWLRSTDVPGRHAPLTREMDWDELSAGAQASLERRMGLAIAAFKAALAAQGYAIVPREASTVQLDRAAAFALNVKLSGQYSWSDYMRDLYGRFLSADEERENG